MIFRRQWRPSRKRRGKKTAQPRRSPAAPKSVSSTLAIALILIKVISTLLELRLFHGLPHKRRTAAVRGAKPQNEGALVVLVEVGPVQHHDDLQALAQDEGNPGGEQRMDVQAAVGKEAVDLLDGVLGVVSIAQREALPDGLLFLGMARLRLLPCHREAAVALAMAPPVSPIFLPGPSFSSMLPPPCRNGWAAIPPQAPPARWRCPEAEPSVLVSELLMGKKPQLRRQKARSPPTLGDPMRL